MRDENLYPITFHLEPAECCMQSSTSLLHLLVCCTMQDDHTRDGLSSPESVLEAGAPNQEGGGSALQNVAHAIIRWETRNMSIMGLDHQLLHLDGQEELDPFFLESTLLEPTAILGSMPSLKTAASEGSNSGVAGRDTAGNEGKRPGRENAQCDAEGSGRSVADTGSSSVPASSSLGSTSSTASAQPREAEVAAAAERKLPQKAEKLPFAATSELMAAVVAAASPPPPASQPRSTLSPGSGSSNLKPLRLEDIFTSAMPRRNSNGSGGGKPPNFIRTTESWPDPHASANAEQAEHARGKMGEQEIKGQEYIELAVPSEPAS